MIDFKVDKVNNFQIFDANTLEPIAEFDGIKGITIESGIEPSSLSKETLSFTHEATFEVSGVDLFSLPLFYTTFVDKPFNLEYSTPIMVQSRWHKKKRINKKWLKRYGMKQDSILVQCDVKSISPDDSYDPYDLVKSQGFNMELGDMHYKFRPDQLRRNLRIEACYE